MTLAEIKGNLCSHDPRNPKARQEHMKREGSDKTDCLCNNCSQGRTALAEDLLFLHEIISNEAKQHKVSEA